MPAMAAIPLNSRWFRSYSRAVLTEDLRLRRIFVNLAIDVINETLCRPDLEETEREAVSAAAHNLHLMERERLNNGS